MIAMFFNVFVMSYFNFCISVIANNLNNTRTTGVQTDPSLPDLVLFLAFLGNAPPPRAFRLQAREFCHH